MEQGGTVFPAIMDDFEDIGGFEDRLETGVEGVWEGEGVEEDEMRGGGELQEAELAVAG